VLLTVVASELPVLADPAIEQDAHRLEAGHALQGLGHADNRTTYPGTHNLRDLWYNEVVSEKQRSDYEESPVTKQRSLRLRRASAYFRLAAKADRAGQHRQGDHWRGVANRLVEENRREVEARRRRSATHTE
jgi:hypothetical protein